MPRRVRTRRSFESSAEVWVRHVPSPAANPPARTGYITRRCGAFSDEHRMRGPTLSTTWLRMTADSRFPFPLPQLLNEVTHKQPLHHRWPGLRMCLACAIVVARHNASCSPLLRPPAHSPMIYPPKKLQDRACPVDATLPTCWAQISWHSQPATTSH